MELIKKHILVVDDDPALRALYQVLLKSYGYSSDTAENGRFALTKLKQTSYDAVLLDYMMPGITGLTVLQHIQEHHPSTPVVMITGYIDGQMAARALAAGARACLYKPFDSKEFKEVLSELVGMPLLRAVTFEQLAQS
jgi:CheY-like chemotaxis protein